MPAAIASACSGHFSQRAFRPLTWILQQASADVWTIFPGAIYTTIRRTSTRAPLSSSREKETCDATKCECAADSEARGCWDDNISTLGATLGSLDTENTWRKYVERRRVGQAPQRQQTSGCEVGVTGTLQRAPTANTSPQILGSLPDSVLHLPVCEI